jgi:hypothetical protein
LKRFFHPAGACPELVEGAKKRLRSLRGQAGTEMDVYFLSFWRLCRQNERKKKVASLLPQARNTLAA